MTASNLPKKLVHIKHANKTIHTLNRFNRFSLLSFHPSAVRQENERLMQETMSRSKPPKNFTHAAIIAPLSVGQEIP